jgi:hypothetical protein
LARFVLRTLSAKCRTGDLLVFSGAVTRLAEAGKARRLAERALDLWVNFIVAGSVFIAGASWLASVKPEAAAPRVEPAV